MREHNYVSILVLHHASAMNRSACTPVALQVPITFDVLTPGDAQDHRVKSSYGRMVNAIVLIREAKVDAKLWVDQSLDTRLVNLIKSCNLFG